MSSEKKGFFRGLVEKMGASRRKTTSDPALFRR